MLHDNRYIEIRHKKGLIRINRLVNQNDNDYNKLYQIAEYFADKGSVVELAPKMSCSSNFEYESLYYDLIGTKYEGKCPDLKLTVCGMNMRVLLRIILKQHLEIC